MLDIDLTTLASSEPFWVALAFVLGLVAKLVKLPPLVGYLVAGYLVGMLGTPDTTNLDVIANIGITLLLFTIGLKLDLNTLKRPQVWAITNIHILAILALTPLVIALLGLLGNVNLAGLSIEEISLLAFALSFSSTVFVVKVLEESGDANSLHGRIAVGILVMQDIVAVLFIAIASAKVPSVWALIIVPLLFSRPVLHRILHRVGHGELLALFGFLLALGGAQLFDAVNLKADLGALIFGILVANHEKTDELAKRMFSFKDLFLLAFFLSIGASGHINANAVTMSLLFLPLLALKLVLFFALFALFNLRVRTAILASIRLTNFSEFGLIVLAYGATIGLIAQEMVVAFSLTLALSFVIAAIGNALVNDHYHALADLLRRFQRDKRIDGDEALAVADAEILIVGMGQVGTGTYDAMRAAHGRHIVGVDTDPVAISAHQESGRRVLLGDPSDPDFWDRSDAVNSLHLIILAIPHVPTSLEIVERLTELDYTGEVVATAKYEEDEDAFLAAGVNKVFNMYIEAGAGLALHAEQGRQSQ